LRAQGLCPFTVQALRQDCIATIDQDDLCGLDFINLDRFFVKEILDWPSEQNEDQTN